MNGIKMGTGIMKGQPRQRGCPHNWRGECRNWQSLRLPGPRVGWERDRSLVTRRNMSKLARGGGGMMEMVCWCRGRMVKVMSWCGGGMVNMVVRSW